MALVIKLLTAWYRQTTTATFWLSPRLSPTTVRTQLFRVRSVVRNIKVKTQLKNPCMLQSTVNRDLMLESKRRIWYTKRYWRLNRHRTGSRMCSVGARLRHQWLTRRIWHKTRLNEHSSSYKMPKSTSSKKRPNMLTKWRSESRIRLSRMDSLMAVVKGMGLVRRIQWRVLPTRRVRIRSMGCPYLRPLCMAEAQDRWQVDQTVSSLCKMQQIGHKARVSWTSHW